MQKILVFLFLGYCTTALGIQQTHPHSLKSDFPYGLLTDDFGILNTKDLKTNTCIAGPTPFSDQDKTSPYPYWQCFEVKNAKMICERGKYDQDEKAVMSMLVVSGQRDGELHEFISRRPIALWTCQLYQKNWLKLTKNEKHVCVSGADHSKVVQEAIVKRVWFFGRYKTQKGCDSYFQDECDVQRVCGI